MQLPKHVHVVGICGVATSALAIAFHRRGVRVSGSDKGFFPPVSTELEKQGVTFYAGWHPEKMIEGGAPDVLIVGTASGSTNPETAYAKEHGIPIYSFAEAIGHYFARENSIVCVGTWGKTSSSALLSHILISAGMDPSYMFGGVSQSHQSSAALTDSKWSVFEGDEYKSSPTDPTAKFFYYKPTHLLLSAVSWDHADLYPTEEAYFDAFRKLISTLPQNGFITACIDNEGVTKLLKDYKGKVVWYSRTNTPAATFKCGKVYQDSHGIHFKISCGPDSWHIDSPMLGVYQAENITGCFAMAHSLGVPAEKIVSAITTFQGMKRRMERRLVGDVTIIDDIAHSPEKAASALASLKGADNIYVIAVFEPNSGGRERSAAAKYDHAFKDADVVIIPRLTKLKVKEGSTEQPMDGQELADTIGKTHKNVKYIDDDEQVVSYLMTNAKKGGVIAFLGSHGFRGMIEETVKIFN